MIPIFLTGLGHTVTRGNNELVVIERDGRKRLIVGDPGEGATLNDMLQI